MRVRTAKYRSLQQPRQVQVSYILRGSGNLRQGVRAWNIFADHQQTVRGM
jgi:hypothetical protein